MQHGDHRRRVRQLKPDIEERVDEHQDPFSAQGMQVEMQSGE